MLVFVKIGECSLSYLLLIGRKESRSFGAWSLLGPVLQNGSQEPDPGVPTGASNAIPIPEQITLVTIAGVPGSTVRRPHGLSCMARGVLKPCSPPARGLGVTLLCATTRLTREACSHPVGPHAEGLRAVPNVLPY